MDFLNSYLNLFDDECFIYKYSLHFGLVEELPKGKSWELSEEQKEVIHSLEKVPNDLKKTETAVRASLISDMRNKRSIDFESFVYLADYFDRQEVARYAMNFFKELRKDDKELRDDGLDNQDNFIDIVGTSYFDYDEKLFSLYLFLKRFGLADSLSVREYSGIRRQMKKILIEENPGIYSSPSLYRLSKFPQLVDDEIRLDIARALEIGLNDLKDPKRFSFSQLGSFLLALQVFEKEKSDCEVVQQAIDFLADERSDDGSWRIHPRDNGKFEGGDLYSTIICTQALATRFLENESTYLQESYDWIMSNQTPLGILFDKHHDSIWATVGALQLAEILERPRRAYRVFVFRKALPCLDESGYDSIICKVNNLLNAQLPSVRIQEKDSFLEILGLLLKFIRFERNVGLFKNIGKISEHSFKSHLVSYLDCLDKTVITEQDLGGGKLDISIDGVIIELKVASTCRPSKTMTSGHQNQLVQYMRAGNRHVGILFTLLSRKKSRVMLSIDDLYGLTSVKNSRGNVESIIVALFAEANYGIPSSH